jgi:copper chaperone CopZ
MKQYKLTLLIYLLLTGFIAGAQDGSATNDTTATFKVFGVCAQCKQRIEKALTVKGIAKAQWDIPTKLLTVTYNPSAVSFDDIQNKITAVGHDTEFKKAKDEVYNALPECCHYREKSEQSAASETSASSNQHNINGIVVAEDNKGNFFPLAGASILWAGTLKGTKTDIHGVFSIPHEEPGSKLVVSYSGYHPDTIAINNMNDLQIVLAANGQLNEVKVTSRRRSVYVDMYNPFRIASITPKELLKAACCNLSESFETNPSVDVSYSDAVTGSKQIQLLGLSGNYTQLTVENLPGPRGLATPLGLNSIAGPWIEGIQLSKGTGSVVNGYESIAGQINVELKKPETSERLYANAYVNSMGKTDLNLNLAQKLSDKWSMGLLLHDDFLYNKTDFNKDGFRDLPTGNQFSTIARWKFDNAKGFMLQFGAKALIDEKTGGEMDYTKEHQTSLYGLGINTNRYEGFAKIGYVFPEKKYQSIGLQLSAFSHKQDAYFGLTPYNAEQKNFYSNLIYQNIIGNTDHKFRTGLSFSADKYDELYKTQGFQRKEIVPGAFFEYTYSLKEKFNVVAGLRADHNSLFGFFATPRLNIRYEPVKGTMLRLNAGRGQRTANIFAENIGALVSARTVNIIGATDGKAYGLDPEVAWNKGISVDQKLKLFKRDALVSVDFFRNDFTNQVVVDLEDARQVKFYNLNGKSYSNSLQTEVNMTPAKNFDVRIAYRWFDVKTTYSDKLLQKPLTAENRAFANLAYELKGWKLDYTVNFIGRKRIPSTAANPEAYRLSDYSPNYVTMNAQVSKTFGKAKAFEWYAGGENLINYFQQNAILSASQPFSNYFDASLIWGPVSGRLLYTGFRYKIK